MNKRTEKTNHIIIFRSDNELDDLAVSKIVGYFDDVLVINDIDTLKDLMLDPCPKVIFFSNEHLEASFQQYYDLVDSVKIGEFCEHKFVAFCNKKDEEVAFAAYNTDIIDEYLVSRPLYELTRPILLAKQLLRELGVHYAANGKVEYKITKLDLKNELTELIETSLQRKKVFKQDIENSIIRLDSAITAAQDKFSKNQKADLNLDEVKTLLGQIKSNEIRPELLELQNKALSLLNRFVKSTANIVNKLDPAATPLKQEQSSDNNTLNKNTAASNATQDNIDYEARLSNAEPPSKIKVLLVEDDPISLNLSAKLFKNKRYEFDYAISGREALNKLNNQKYHIVFMDINLPDSDGLSIVSQLTNNNSTNLGTSIVVLTGSHSKLSVKRAGQVGAKLYLLKPLRQASLQKALEKCNLV